MAVAVCMGATMMCSFGVAPGSLVVIPSGQAMTPAVPSADTTSFAPIANIPSFGSCTSMSNPSVASATSAALGVLTPMPCVPVTSSPWTPGVSTVVDGASAAVDSSCTLMCNWGGSISVLNPGQTVVMAG
ncbi:DUF4280 domain-containing protein [Pseudenhygromyxa sp. WMMC2535]|uniref:DUF4280 domain-containing protein n=1 Tax=Pseudenhygromyxa sp. WMMC2535 TaxID=2712867 RepID=UPI0015570EE5|nr:DUF4280 domain-containing protein [Pseudenhygromyxa sp. WMMC2535]NVB39244.1 DUF4280 domain-containing protein [Pseudenhygromyxa sp. WMMC2535]